MFVLGLLTWIALRAFSAQAEVVENFQDCSQFFYEHTEPGGMDQNAKKICQKINITNARVGTFYATLYSVPLRIPLYSAYTLKRSCSDAPGRTNKWHLEPQISGDQTEYMVPESKKNQKTYKVNQAISSDYEGTGYDRGHLNPNSFSCTKPGRTATDTLTNAAPMDPCFNRIQWKNWERTLKSFLTKNLDSDDGTAYIVTGTVPDENTRIPQREEPEDSNRVSVPSHIWTAVCYEHNDNDESFSFGYIGENLPGGRISLMSVSQLNNRLNELYKRSNIELYKRSNIQIFDDCSEDINKLSEVKNQFNKLINLPVNQGVQVSPDVQNTYRAIQSVTDEEDVTMTEMNVKFSFKSLSSYSTAAEEMKVSTGSACLITNYGQESVECQLGSKKRKFASDGSFCSRTFEFSRFCRCITEDETKRCCSTPCLYQNNLKSYRCYSDQNLVPCSPQYSLITYKGERCKDDHPCGTYGEDYYWCKTTTNNRDYCSPPLWRSKAENGQYCRRNHACAKYGKSQQWCYTNDGSEHECCASDDCYSTVSGKTCRSDHLCGYHGRNRLWCQTTDGSIDDCCTECGWFR